MRCRVLIPLLLLGVLQACVAHLPGLDQEQEAIYEQPLEEVWPHVRVFFQEKGFAYREDAANFVLETEWRQEFNGSQVAGYWHRYMVVGKRVTPSRGRLWVVRASRSANPALRAPGADISWGVTQGVRGVPEQGTLGTTDEVDVAMEKLSMTDGTTLPQSAQGARDVGVERELYERIAPELAAGKKAHRETPDPEAVVKRVASGDGTAPKAVADCGEPIPELEKVARRGNVVLLGELHGTREVPHFLAQSVCQAATRGLPVTVGLELPASNQERLQHFLASAGTEQDWALLMEGPFWHSPYPDGRGSEAVAYLIETLRKLRGLGLDVDAFAFDHPQFRGEEHEEAMAKTVLEVAGRSKERLMLVVTGNLHPRLVKGTSWDLAFRPMGLRIAEAHPAVLSLDMAYDSGTAWLCAPDDQQGLACGVKQARGRDNGSRYFLHLFGNVSREGYHGIFYVGPVSASNPAVYQGVEPAGETQASASQPAPAPGRATNTNRRLDHG